MILCDYECIGKSSNEGCGNPVVDICDEMCSDSYKDAKEFNESKRIKKNEDISVHENMSVDNDIKYLDTNEIIN